MTGARSHDRVTADARRAAEQRASDVDRLQYELIGMQVLARRLWRALKARTGFEAEDLFAHDIIRVLDPSYEAADAIWTRHCIVVEPCRRVHDHQGERYLAHFPGGETRNITREQLMMMAGMSE